MLLSLLMASAVLAGAPDAAAPNVPAAVAGVASVAGAPARPQPDSADILLRAGNDALARGDNRRAAELFQRLAERYPRTSAGNDGRYFQAYALYRIGEPDDLRRARRALDGLREVDNRALRSDALALDTRICGELAKRGDEQCARTVTTRAETSDLSMAIGDMVRATTAAASETLASAAVQTAVASAGRAITTGVDIGLRAASDALTQTSIALSDVGMGMRSSRRSSECDKDDDNDVAVIALNAVQQMDADRAMPLLKKVMARRDKCAEVLRRQAVMLIARKKAPESADLLIDAARNDPDADVRQQAVFWLSRVDGDRAATFLREVATKPGDTEVRKQAVYALSQNGTVGAREALRQVASSDPDTEVRSQAIHWLGSRGSDEDVAWLRGLYPKLESRKLKDQVLATLARKKGNGDWLLGIALDSKESIESRKQALYWAGQSGAPVEQLVALYDRTNDKEMKDQLIYVLQQRGRGPAFDKLLQIARDEKDPEARKTALYWVSRVNDPRVDKLLEDLVNTRKP